MKQEATPVIEFDHVSKIYENGVVGLKDINLTIMPGEFVVVVGLSGAGKSTLMRAVNRLHDISEGDIRIDGESITKAKGKKLRQIRRKIGMIFQNFNLINRATVLRNVLTGRVGYYPTWKMVFGLFSPEDKQRAYQALQTVELADKVYTRADQLSGGQQQRVSIARALTQAPSLILADEPIASLDPETTRRVMDDLKRINQELGMTVLVNLHQVDLAQAYGSRIIGIRAGEKVFDGPVSEATSAVFDEIYNGAEAEG
ncbi:MAG: phosphonate ABC transporter ATP-binding protein [Lactobacillus sp.]|jgi:phosphonate transport system ATP-binding protein|uniref:phosphonate ABC transporter ATP-binding protein n=1 Tax=Lacticaseibacillus suilingensis TaxID=2799577 RepID=UPI0022E4378A|nr:phosphonate ABC transporter ATP-binding protein [Lacticaseibacillus suilingensis]MCI1894751.1 phosphonate ABC transporter ATP-binding protein [Lactobacillus sp.]MCI1918419.1 phosphonate ABC transporter ATP-binding protein [Lactobacillus sp.]MCI1942341.1 phosphonate ABC transporter ATP-binding protein [Lactobacillus sp.]MCI1972803.1 phosphonate ABC transporter ATP-binding protein [Lactobacillus sp.]MCI2016463.1 phosphonate ABC transporter ATP-binding protein [Lactobacillus sp.]